jgi:uncharacterized protein (TIGR02594 family)
MHIKRRDLLKVMGICAASAAVNSVCLNLRAQTPVNSGDLEKTAENNLPPLPDDLVSAQSTNDINDVTKYVVDFGVTGIEPPTDAEKELGNNILGAAPIKTEPFRVAEYFLRVAGGEFGADRKQFCRAWPVRANPVIVGFFKATDLKPAGDVTAWCAAFVNWCYGRAGLTDPSGSMKSATDSASSGSFRTWGKEVKPENAKLGDIVVFELLHGTHADPARGHVGFFVSFDSTSKQIVILGGNQFEGKPVVHAINTKPIGINGSVLRLNSVRTDPSLHA